MLQLGKQCCCYIKLLSVCVRSCMHSDSVHLCAACPNDNLWALYQKLQWQRQRQQQLKICIFYRIIFSIEYNLFMKSQYFYAWYNVWATECVCMSMINIFQCLECLALPHSHLTVAHRLFLFLIIWTHTHKHTNTLSHTWKCFWWINFIIHVRAKHIPLRIHIHLITQT